MKASLASRRQAKPTHLPTSTTTCKPHYKPENAPYATIITCNRHTRTLPPHITTRRHHTPPQAMREIALHHHTPHSTSNRHMPPRPTIAHHHALPPLPRAGRDRDLDLKIHPKHAIERNTYERHVFEQDPGPRSSPEHAVETRTKKTYQRAHLHTAIFCVTLKYTPNMSYR